MTQAIRILPDLSQAQPSALELEVAKLRAENEALRQAQPKGRITLKVTDKGGLSLYGLGRFPVTLYRGQWERLLGAKDEIVAFIEANAARLSVKD